jgi:uncharacterized protein YbjT (DUF2867 family)
MLMTMLLIGGTGQIGSAVVSRLATEPELDIQVLTPNPDKAKVPKGVTVKKGDVLDIAALRSMLAGVDTLFILNPVVADEQTRALLTLRLAKDAGVKGVVYFSMVNSDVFADTPHASAKFAAERMIERFEIPATILRPNCFFQNDAMVKQPLLEQGRYAMPVGNVGVAMVDTSDVAEVAALEMLERERAMAPQPLRRVEISGPETLTGPSIAAIWSDVLGRPVSYAGDDTEPLERQSARQMKPVMAFDTTLMFRGFQRDGMLPSPDAAQAIEKKIGRPLRTYRAFAEQMKKAWLNA